MLLGAGGLAAAVWTGCGPAPGGGSFAHGFAAGAAAGLAGAAGSAVGATGADAALPLAQGFGLAGAAAAPASAAAVAPGGFVAWASAGAALPEQPASGNAANESKIKARFIGKQPPVAAGINR